MASTPCQCAPGLSHLTFDQHIWSTIAYNEWDNCERKWNRLCSRSGWKEHYDIFINYNPLKSNLEYPIIISVVLLIVGLIGESQTRKHASLSWQAGR